MRTGGYRFFAIIPLQAIGIDHVHEIGLNQSNFIVIYGRLSRPETAGASAGRPCRRAVSAEHDRPTDADG
jgi:hypothetical protein